MSDLEAWLDSRRPRAPDALRRRVTEALRGAAVGEQRASVPSEGGPDGRVEELLEAARARLRAAAGRPGRVRESAFELLVADALVTYACEAALETERPTEALRRVMEVGRPS